MKKLIALIAAIAVMMSMSVTSFAAFTDEIALNADGKTYTAALPTDAATANDGKQTTIVAYTGDEIAVGSIQYINQDAVDEFTFQLKDALTADVKVVMGGENIDKQEIGTIFFQEAEPTTISGTVSNHVPASFIDGDLTSYITDIYGEEAVEDYKAKYAITAYLVAESETENVIDWSIGGESTFEAIASQTVSFEDGTYSFEVEEDGTYIVILARDGGLTWIDYAIVADGESVVFDAIDMYLGDVVGAKDGMIDGSDIGEVLGNLVDIEDGSWNAVFDVSPDCMNDGSDVGTILSNLVDITAYGTSFTDQY